MFSPFRAPYQPTGDPNPQASPNGQGQNSSVQSSPFTDAPTPGSANSARNGLINGAMGSLPGSVSSSGAAGNTWNNGASNWNNMPNSGAIGSVWNSNPLYQGQPSIPGQPSQRNWEAQQPQQSAGNPNWYGAIPYVGNAPVPGGQSPRIINTQPVPMPRGYDTGPFAHGPGGMTGGNIGGAYQGSPIMPNVGGSMGLPPAQPNSSEGPGGITGQLPQQWAQLQQQQGNGDNTSAGTLSPQTIAELMSHLGNMTGQAGAQNDPAALAATLARAQATGMGSGAVGATLPGRAEGGPVTPNQPYVVGEKGPEVIVPSQPGTVVPNQPLQMATGTPQQATKQPAPDPSQPSASIDFSQKGSPVVTQPKATTAPAQPPTSQPAALPPSSPMVTPSGGIPPGQPYQLATGSPYQAPTTAPQSSAPTGMASSNGPLSMAASGVNGSTFTPPSPAAPQPAQPPAPAPASPAPAAPAPAPAAPSTPAGNPMDPAYIGQQITAYVTAHKNDPGFDQSLINDPNYWIQKIQSTGGWTDHTPTGGNNIGYWTDKFGTANGGAGGSTGSSGGFNPAGGSGFNIPYGPGGIPTGANGMPTGFGYGQTPDQFGAQDKVLNDMLTNNVLTPEMINQMNQTGNEQIARGGQQQMRQFNQNAAGRGVFSGGTAQAQRDRLADQATQAQVGNTRDVNLQAAQINRQGMINAIQASNSTWNPRAQIGLGYGQLGLGYDQLGYNYNMGNANLEQQFIQHIMSGGSSV